MTDDKDMPSLLDAFGPKQTPELVVSFKTQVATSLGFEMKDFELDWLCRNVRHVVTDGLFRPPVSGTSYKAVDDLSKAAYKLLVALKNVQAVAREPFEIRRGNLADQFLSDVGLIDDDEDEDELMFSTPDETIARVIADFQLLHRRAWRAIGSAKRVERGAGRKLQGYDNFILACRQVWDRNRTDKGWSEKNGRGCGPFVTFVFLAQDLLRPPMRKGSVEAVGDAVKAALKDTK
jgi:hypothetical protein